MQFLEQEVTLQLNSRPLRLVYLVRSREDLINAVTLYTHVWGGAANAILPIPENDVEADTFNLALRWIDPDYIFIPRQGIPPYIDQVLHQLPALQRPISLEEIQEHIHGYNLIYLHKGTLSHIGLILESLYPNSLENSNIRLVEPSNIFNLELALQGGVPTQLYRNYLVQNLAADVFSPPHTIEQLIKLSLLLSQGNNPISLTMSKTRRKWDAFEPYNMWTNDAETLCLFLDDDQNIGIATAFWNCSWLFPKNKLFLPREAFLKDIEHHASLIVEVLPTIRALFVTSPIDPEGALALCSHLKNAFAAAGREVLVKVSYRDFRFDWIKGAVSFGNVVNFTRIRNPDGSIRFDLPVPFGHENTEFAFGYNAEVKFASGKLFSIPATPAASVLLRNELWRIERAENNQDGIGELWLRQDSPVRAAAKGITGTALAGKECHFYVHPDDVVIIRQLKDAGFKINPNKHTRYAQGFVKRFGGFEKTRHLVNQGGLNIISVLRHPQAKEGGLNFQQTVEFMSQRGISKDEARNLLEQQLPLLLSSRLVRRGYSLRCCHCDLTEWYSIEDAGEFVECMGCAEPFQLSLKNPVFAYKPNELAARFVEEGGQAVLMTAALLYQIEPSAFIKFGGIFYIMVTKRIFQKLICCGLLDVLS
ncbi:hypothetical protein H6F78_18125 [Coleofasciculus sp. FACHB-64]|uniref:hypothetical protein n=1 Tax=Cyanophyceae TaxID=3028117 RepID=UPI00168389D8|nr:MULTISPECIES: hypothetical protein [unclassified Coleofasciculus]MBD1841025.1 hypothetical protein [Coleofasciculus sp. FACHB-501]MBD2047488.1 hypothetical protein [Coleofasciculus sp. FACHB-64]